MMRKLDQCLLIVSHVLVRCHNGSHYLQGGFGRHVEAFARCFDKVCLLTCLEPADSPPDLYRLRADNVEVVSLPNIWHAARLARYAKQLRGILSAAMKLPALIKFCDLIHPRIPSPIGTVGAVAAKLSHKPAFIYIAGDQAESIRSKGPMFRPLAGMARRFISTLVSDELCFTAGEVLSRKLGGPNERLVPVVTTAMDRRHLVEPSVALARAAREPQEILFVGVVGRAKGVHVLLRAFRRLRDLNRHVRLRLIGGTTDGGRWLTQQIDSLHLGGAVVHHDHMAWNKLIYEYDRSDVFALPTLPSRGEGVPKVVTEAMARGVPVVTTEVGGIPSVVRHGESGLLVEPDSSDELVDALLKLLDDVELRQRLVQGGLEVAERHILEDLIDGMVQKVCEYHRLACPGEGVTE